MAQFESETDIRRDYGHLLEQAKGVVGQPALTLAANDMAAFDRLSGEADQLGVVLQRTGDDDADASANAAALIEAKRQALADLGTRIRALVS
jgi:hypothetical protein